jgi:hypothetical protein
MSALAPERDPGLPDVVDLIAGSGLEFRPRGEHQLKGVPRHLADLRSGTK